MKNVVVYSVIVVLFIPLQALGLGDLLLTVKQRATIDVARENGTLSVGTRIVGNKIKMNGFYFNNHDKKEDAKIWINGKQVNGTLVTDGVELKQVNERDKIISLRLDKTQRSIPVRAGQTLQLDNGQISDSFE